MTGRPATVAAAPEPLLARARAVWTGLAGAPVAFPPPGGIHVVVSPESRLCPSSWLGIVVLGAAAIATAPDERAGAALRAALPAIPMAAFTDMDRLRRVLPMVGIAGPATLAYLAAADFSPAGDPSSVEALPAGGADLAAFLAAVPPAEATRSELTKITSDAFVIRADGAVVAAAGYSVWPHSVAHLCVLTAPAARARGLARRVASAATADALSRRLLPQWRAEPEPSRRVAAALGFRQLGVQFGLLLAVG